LTVFVSKNVRTVTLSSPVTGTATADDQKASADVASSVPPPPDSEELHTYKPVSKALDTAALAAALPCASSTISGSAFSGYNFSTAFSKSETGLSYVLLNILSLLIDSFCLFFLYSDSFLLLHFCLFLFCHLACGNLRGKTESIFVSLYICLGWHKDFRLNALFVN